MGRGNVELETFDDVLDFATVVPVSGGGLGAGIIAPDRLSSMRDKKLHAHPLFIARQT